MKSIIVFDNDVCVPFAKIIVDDHILEDLSAKVLSGKMWACMAWDIAMSIRQVSVHTR